HTAARPALPRLVVDRDGPRDARPGAVLLPSRHARVRRHRDGRIGYTRIMTTKTLNVLDPDFYVDPWADYRWLRDNAPAYWDPVQKIWAISRYEDIVAIEKDAARYSSLAGSRPKTDQRADTSMINRDDPHHQEQRMLVNRRFTPRAVKEHEDHVRGVVTELIDAVLPLGECDAVESLASPLPAIMIGDLLGYPRELWTKVRE